jgi:hypothetical protein
MSQRDSNAPAKNVDRRASRRVPCGFALQMRIGSAWIDVTIMNISTTGMFVRPAGDVHRSALSMATRLKPGARLFLRFEVEGRLELHEARGCVAWQSDLGVGVDFSELSPAMRELISKLIEGNGHTDATLLRVFVVTLYQPA